MKKKMRNRMLAMVLMAVLIVGTISEVNAKFWGWQTTGTTDWADGTCAYRETCRVHYILWFAGEEQCTTTTIGCIDYN